MDEPRVRELKKGELNLFIHVGLLVSLYLAYRVLFPLVDAIVFAAVLASLSTPLKNYVERKIPGRKNLAALLVVLAAAVVLTVPLLLILGALAAEGVTAMARFQEWIAGGGMARFLERPDLLGLLEWAKTNLPFGAEIDVEKQLLALSEKAGAVLWKQGTAVAANAVNLVVQLFMLFFIMFYFVRDGRRFLDEISALTPLERKQDALIILRVRQMAKSVFVGSFLTALVQGMIGGLGFFIVGIPGFFWGAVMAVTSLIPFVGTALVWLPATAYLMITGQYWSGLFLLVWCLVLVSGIDNFIRPFLMRGEGGLPPFYVFLALIGGIKLFGLSGILYGPLVITFAAAILDLYKGEFLQKKGSAA